MRLWTELRLGTGAAGLGGGKEGRNFYNVEHDVGT